MLVRLFTEHPKSVDESYFEHLLMASSFGLTMVFYGLLCFVHALLPFLFEKSASKAIDRLYVRMVTNRNRKNAAKHSHPTAAAE
ncbi:DUF6356 family protein [Kordiimonas sp. SCSIO 12610]|uniref:DUF6356 family protein n=1 Tax=Kordiimonas sp. SCSIO 12610 TaxID=2829597 RepID=UPI00210D7859|nr:DUF6356 family protein [Kordiimonas sp. SCSIO 12610]UTW55849.1 hypothetical protein KFF44_02865 [Kordiimonas sp. SCSIO 12610]